MIGMALAAGLGVIGPGIGIGLIGGGAMEAIGLCEADLPAILQDLEQAPDVVLNYTGPGRQESDYVTITKGLLAAMTRSIWGPKESPPLGGFWAALGRLQKAA